MVENFGDKRNTNGFDKRPNDTTKGGRKKDLLKAALEKLAETEGKFPISTNEVIGLVDIQEDVDGSPLITIKGEWAKGKGGEVQKSVALLIARLPDMESIAVQWYRDAKSRQSNVRMRSRETLADRMYGKAQQVISANVNSTGLEDLTEDQLRQRLENLESGE